MSVRMQLRQSCGWVFGALLLVALPGHAHPSDNSGCADRQREGFRDISKWPDIAGCAGAWRIPGIHTENPGEAPACPGLATFDTLTPACGRQGGDDGPRPGGAGCNVADLCAPGWHVCASDAEVASRSPTGCEGVTHGTAQPLFFATRQSTNGCALCANGTSTGPECNSDACVEGCLQTAFISNDFFGCGNFGVEATCGPLNRFSENLCAGLAGGTPWSCDAAAEADDNGLCEAYTVIKTGSKYGGVLCCRDTPTVTDADSACDSAGRCPGTVLPGTPSEVRTGEARFADTDGDGTFDASVEDEDTARRPLPLADTAG